MIMDPNEIKGKMESQFLPLYLYSCYKYSVTRGVQKVSRD